MRLGPDALLASEAARREETDYRFRWGTYIGWAILTLGIYTQYGTYRLIQRRAEHGRRRFRFSAALWHALAERADGAGRRYEAQPGLDNLSRIHAQMEDHERRNKRNPVIWLIVRVALGGGGAWLRIQYDTDDPSDPAFQTIVAIVALLAVANGFVGAYINHFLNADFRFLDTWERSLGENAAWTLDRLGLPAPVPSRAAPVPRRSTPLYVILTVITAGVFAIAWRSFTMKDGNDHFDDDGRMEDAILAALGVSRHAVGAPLPPPAW